MAPGKRAEAGPSTPDLPLEALDLPVRAYRGLKAAGIDRISQLCALGDEELTAIEGIGLSTLVGIRIKLRRHQAGAGGLQEPLARPRGRPKKAPSSPAGAESEPGPPPPPPSPTPGAAPGPPLDRLGLSARPYNALWRAGIDTIARLAPMSDEQLLAIRNLGVDSLQEIRRKLEDYFVEQPGYRAPAAPETPLDLLALSARPYNQLRRAGINTIAQLAPMSDEQLLAIRNLGVDSLQEIRQKLEDYYLQQPDYRGPPAPGRPKSSPALAKPAAQAPAPASSAPPAPYRPPIVHPAVLARAPGMPLSAIPVQRLSLPPADLRLLAAQGITTIADLARQPASELAPDSRIGERVIWYVEWLADQDQDTWASEAAGQGISPVHRLLLRHRTLDQLIAGWLQGIKAQDVAVLRLRLGADGPPLTAEETARQLKGLSALQVRYVQDRALTALKAHKTGDEISALIETLRDEFFGAGGLMAEREVVERLPELAAVEKIEPAWAARLLLHMSDKFEGPKKGLWALPGRSLDLVPPSVEGLVELLRHAGEPVPVPDLLASFWMTAFGREHEAGLDAAFLAAVIRVSGQIQSDGLRAWLGQAAQGGEPGRAAAPLPATLLEWERILEPQVRQVELLGEISITEEECTQLGKAIGRRLKTMAVTEAVRVVRNNYPCAFAVYLVAQGIYGYEGGDYWSSVRDVTGVLSDYTWQWGRLFEEILDKLGLPLFYDMRKEAQRYVSLILAHGGIPSYSLPDFFKYMLQPSVAQVKYTGMSAGEVIEEWRWKSIAQGTDKPVLRFLTYGERVAQDLVERCREMAWRYLDSGLVPNADDLGLPERVVAAYREWIAGQDTGQMRRETGSRWGLHRPDLVVDPWGEGVLLNLPPQQVPATEIQSSITWQVADGEAVGDIPVRVRRTGFDWRTVAERQVISRPAAEYQVTLLADGQAKHAWRFPGSDAGRPLVVFDPARGAILPWQYSLPARCLGLLYPAEYTVHVEGPGELLEELPRLPWGWSGFRGQTWNLAGAQRLELRKGGNPTLSVPLRPDESAQRPRLEGGQIALEGDSGGRAPVYVGSPPAVRIPITGRQALEEELARWRLTIVNKWAARPEIDLTTTLADVHAGLIVAGTHVDLPLHLPSLLGTAPAGNFSVRLRGPLGRDAEFTLRVVPHLRIQGHDRLYLPDPRTGPQPALLHVETPPGYQVEWQGEGEGCELVGVERREETWETQLRVGAEVTDVELTLTYPLSASDAIRVPVLVPIRRLRWTLIEDQAGSSRREWAGQAVKRPVDTLLQLQSPCLLVELPRAEGDEVRLRLRLLDVTEGQDEELQAMDWAAVPAARGQRLRRFELGAFLDTIRQARHSPILRLNLEAYGLTETKERLSWPVLSLTRTLLVEDVHLAVQRAETRPIFDLRWREPTPLKNRRVRFWPLWRPWDEFYEQPIPDDAAGEFTFEPPAGKLRSGKYRLEFLVVDPWVPQPADKPGKGSPGTSDVELISAKRQLQRLDAKLQDKTAPFDLFLERAVLYDDLGSPEQARPDRQWCYDHLDDGTIPQILTLVELVEAAGHTDTLKALQMKMFSAGRLQRILDDRTRDKISREHFQAYLGNLPRSGLLPQATCRQLLTVEDETVRLHALQQLIRRGAPEGVTTVLSWVEAARMSDADAIAVLSLNAGLSIELLREQSQGSTAQRLLGGLSQAVEDVVHVGDWLRCKLGWGRVDRIEHLDTGKQVQWCVARNSRYRLHVVLRPDVHPEMVTIDLAASQAEFVNRGVARSCAECEQLTTQSVDLMAEHFEAAHRAHGYWERRYRRDHFAKFRLENTPIAIPAMVFSAAKPAKQLV